MPGRYPRPFRREHEEEMLVVLLARAGDSRRRAVAGDSRRQPATARPGGWRRPHPQCDPDADTPRAHRPAPTVTWALRAMVLAAGLELVALATVAGTQAGLRSALAARVPHFSAPQWQAAVHAC